MAVLSDIFRLRGQRPAFQFLSSVLLVGVVAGICFVLLPWIGYKVVALLLLLSVSLLAVLFDILPVLLAAALSALSWNFFFIPPRFTFHIDNAEDLLLFTMYFAVAFVNAVLSFKIRAEAKKSRDKEEQEKLIRLYHTLLNSLSHELRTPIATIIGAVDTLRDPDLPLTPAQRATLLGEVELAGIRLNRQVENLLNMSRLENGLLRLHLDWCDLNERIGSLVERFSREAPAHPIHFTPDEGLPLVRIDAGLIEEVLHNLLHNAVQYTPAGTPIDVAVHLANPGQLLIEVRDHGPGFPADQIALVFDKFYRLPHSKAGGTGLGLSIVKGFVQAHKGEVRLDNAPDGGARFRIQMPVATSFLKNLKHE
jgi:two-component system sensor histidine kinase KdpD